MPFAYIQTFFFFHKTFELHERYDEATMLKVQVPVYLLMVYNFATKPNL